MAETAYSRKWFIYKITSPTGRVYIGKTNSVSNRIRHYRSLNCKSQRLIYHSIKKYGWGKHLFEIIDEFYGSVIDSSNKELFWIRSNMSNCNVFPNMNGMNLTMGGEGSIGRIWTKDQRDKMSEIKKGWTHAPETKIKIRDASKGNKHALGNKHTDEWKRNMSNRLIGHKFNVGKKQSKRTVYKRISKVLGRKDTEEMKMRKSEAQTRSKGRPIVQLNFSADVLNNFISIAQAAKELKWHQSLISKVLKGERESTNNWKFKYI